MILDRGIVVTLLVKAAKKRCERRVEFILSHLSSQNMELIFHEVIYRRRNFYKNIYSQILDKLEDIIDTEDTSYIECLSGLLTSSTREIQVKLQKRLKFEV